MVKYFYFVNTFKGTLHIKLNFAMLAPGVDPVMRVRQMLQRM